MSLISGLFTLPIGYAMLAYKQVRFEFPLMGSENGKDFERIYKSDSRYNEVLQSLPGTHIKKKMQPFLDNVGIRKDIIFAETPNLGFCSGVGTNMFKKYDAAVMIAPGFYEADKDACTWVMKHEISHIKNNDGFTMSCVPGVCQLAAAVFGMCSLSFLPALGVAFTVGIVSHSVFSQWREAKADDFAIENSTDEELKGGRRVLKGFQATNLEERKTFWKRIAISSSGENRLDIAHPSITSRIQKIERILRERGVELDEATENPKMEVMKRYMANKKLEIERAVQQAGGVIGIMNEMWSF